MDKFILEPTSTAHWHLLLTEAQQACELKLSEEHESYLVFTLMRFTSDTQIASSILALEYIEGLQATPSIRSKNLRDVGDKCLLFAGLFPELAHRRRVQVSYFVNLGKSAYSTLSDSHQKSIALLYASLSQEFVSLMDVLQTIRALSNDQHSNLTPLDAADLWNQTGSQHALKTLRKITQAIPMQSPNQDKPDIH